MIFSSNRVYVSLKIFCYILLSKNSTSQSGPTLLLEVMIWTIWINTTGGCFYIIVQIFCLIDFWEEDIRKVHTIFNNSKSHMRKNIYRKQNLSTKSKVCLCLAILEIKRNAVVLYYITLADLTNDIYLHVHADNSFKGNSCFILFSECA